MNNNNAFLVSEKNPVMFDRVHNLVNNLEREMQYHVCLRMSIYELLEAKKLTPEDITKFEALLEFSKSQRA